MKLQSLEIKQIQIPFRVAFVHSAAERSETESVWVEARSATGRVGHGEGCPRSYVTAEDMASAQAFALRHRASLIAEISDLTALRSWMQARPQELDENPAAWCAIELALLDLLARERDQTVEALLELPELDGQFRYSAVIGDMSLESFRGLFALYREGGFSDYKLKLSGDLDRDREKLDWIRREAGADVRVRVDANNLWEAPEEATGFLQALEFPLFGVEEPLRPANRYAALAALAVRCGTRIILDESLLRADQLRELPGPPESWIVNLRVSKMGGLTRSLEVVEAARLRGIQIIVGAQVGETSLLTRAALTAAMQARELLVAQEGAFGKLLLEADVCDPPLMFGEGGVLDVARALPPSGAGFRLDVPDALPFLASLD